MDSIPTTLLAVNYSPESEALLQAGSIQFDLYKLPDWPDLVARIAPGHPAYVHFTLGVGQGEPSCPDWQMIDGLLAATGTPFVNVHLVAPKDYPEGQPVEAILEKAAEDVRCLVERYGPERVILENVPIIRPSDRYLLPVVEPRAIRWVVAATGCGFLLDLAHARLAARALGMDEREYLLDLPVHQIRELHITGIGLHDGFWVDHMALSPEDWELLDWSLAYMRSGAWALPRIASFEYSGLGDPFRWRSEARVLQEQVPELYRRFTG